MDYNEFLLNDFDLNDVQKRVSLEMEKFDLNSFFHSKGASSGAIGLITNKQSIFTDTFVRLNKYPDYGCHIDSVIAIYNAIYDSSFLIAYTSNPSSLLNWQDKVINDGNVLIQFCDPKFDLSMIWIPANVSSYQIEAIDEFNRNLKLIVDNDKQYFEDFPVGFACRYDDEYFDLYNNLDDLVDYLKKGKSYVKRR